MRITLALGLLIVMGCNGHQDKDAQKLAGAYLMVSQGFKNERKDTTDVFVVKLDEGGSVVAK